MSANEMIWSLVILAYASLFGLGILDNARGPYFPDLTRELGLGDTQASLFFAVASMVMIFSGRIVPALVERFGTVLSIRFGLLIMGIGFFSISLIRDLMTMLLAVSLFGLGFGVVNVAQNLLIVEGATPTWRRRLFSGLHSVYALSSLTAPLLASYFFRTGVDWRRAFQIFSISAAFGFIVSFFVKKPALEASVESVRESAGNPIRHYLLVSVQMSFYVLAELTISTRMALYLRRAEGYSPESAAEVLALFFLFLFIGRVLFTAFSFKRLSSLQIIELSLATSLVAFIMGLAVHPLWLALCGLTMAPVFGFAMDFLAERYPADSADAISFCLAINAVFIVSMHFILGALTESYGIEKAIYFGPAALLVSWLLLQPVKKDGLKLPAS